MTKEARDEQSTIEAEPKWGRLGTKRYERGQTMRLIDADALKAKQQEDADLFINDSTISGKIRRDEALNAVANIVNAPTVDAVPVKWLFKQAENPNNSDAFRNFIDELVYKKWRGRDEQTD